jgi:hypothetical protein
MQSLCNQSVMHKMSWSVGSVARVMINAVETAPAHPPPPCEENDCGIIFLDEQRFCRK